VPADPALPAVALVNVVARPVGATPRHVAVIVFGTDGVDGPGPYPDLHQRDEVVPHGVELRAIEVLARTERVDPVPEEHLGAVDVADAGQDLLVHEQGTDGPGAARDPGPGSLRLGVRVEGVGAQSVAHVADLRLGDRLAPGRSTQVDPV